MVSLKEKIGKVNNRQNLPENVLKYRNISIRWLTVVGTLSSILLVVLSFFTNDAFIIFWLVLMINQIISLLLILKGQEVIGGYICLLGDNLIVLINMSSFPPEIFYSIILLIVVTSTVVISIRFLLHLFVMDMGFFLILLIEKVFIGEFNNDFIVSITFINICLFFTYCLSYAIIKLFTVNITDLKNKNDILEEHLFIFSHDLKTPLVSIQGFYTLLRKKYEKELQPGVIHYLDRIGENITNMADLITDSLEKSI